ncbi:MAG: Gluconolactonase, partial [uncultured Corynebacteriales bacterium]
GAAHRRDRDGRVAPLARRPAVRRRLGRRDDRGRRPGRHDRGRGDRPGAGLLLRLPAGRPVARRRRRPAAGRGAVRAAGAVRAPAGPARERHRGGRPRERVRGGARVRLRGRGGVPGRAGRAGLAGAGPAGPDRADGRRRPRLPERDRGHRGQRDADPGRVVPGAAGGLGRGRGRHAVRPAGLGRAGGGHPARRDLRGRHRCGVVRRRAGPAVRAGRGRGRGAGHAAAGPRGVRLRARRRHAVRGGERVGRRGRDGRRPGVHRAGPGP